MTDTAVAPPSLSASENTTASRPFLPALVVLFVGSGCAALIYEIVWLNMLGLEIGGSAISLGVLLGTFMGGMCIGSLLFPRFVPRNVHPLLVYGLLEAAIRSHRPAGTVADPDGVRDVRTLPRRRARRGQSRSGRYSPAWCLLPPTILMGATLPAIFAVCRVFAARRVRGWGSSTAATSSGR